MLIFLLKKYQVVKVMIGYLLGNMILLILSYIVGKALLVFLPEWLLGVLGSCQSTWRSMMMTMRMVTSTIARRFSA